MFRKFFLTSFLLALQFSWGASCYIDCSEISSNPSTSPIPSGVDCSYSNVNYTSINQSWTFPPSSNFTSSGTCETALSNEDNLINSIETLVFAISSLWSAMAFCSGLFTGLFVGRILINVF